MYSFHCYPMWNHNSKYPQHPSSVKMNEECIVYDIYEHLNSKDEEQKNSEFAIIWQKLIVQWNSEDAKLVKCAKSMTKCMCHLLKFNFRTHYYVHLIVDGPIPTNMRAEAWFVISGAAHLQNQHKSLYERLYSCSSDKSDLIEKDLPRTYASNIVALHTRKGSQHCLRRILTAYSNFDPSLGYCQGMNYIAGFLVHIFKGSNEEQAFWTFVIILRRIRSIFIDGLPGFHKLTHYFRKLCVQFRKCLSLSLSLPLFFSLLDSIDCNLHTVIYQNCTQSGSFWALTFTN